MQRLIAQLCRRVGGTRRPTRAARKGHPAIGKPYMRAQTSFTAGGALKPDGLGNLLDELRLSKEQKNKSDWAKLTARRSTFALPLLLLMACYWYLHRGSGAPAPPLHCYFLVDRAASSSLRAAFAAGFNSLVKDQKAVLTGTMLVTLAHFDAKGALDLRYSGQDVRQTPPLKAADLEVAAPAATPRRTALYDAIAFGIEHASRTHPPEATLVVVVTDAESASRRTSRQQLFKAIQTKQDNAGWTFVYLGANQDSYAESKVRAGAHPPSPPPAASPRRTPLLHSPSPPGVPATSQHSRPRPHARALAHPPSRCVLRASPSRRATRPTTCSMRAAFVTPGRTSAPPRPRRAPRSSATAG